MRAKSQKQQEAGASNSKTRTNHTRATFCKNSNIIILHLGDSQEDIKSLVSYCMAARTFLVMPEIAALSSTLPLYRSRPAENLQALVPSEGSENY